MKFKYTLITSVLLSFLGIYIKADIVEKGDTTSVLMALCVFPLPMFIFCILNSLLLKIGERIKTITLLWILALIPVILFLLLSIFDGIPIPYFESNMSFLGSIGLITIGMVNLVWAILQTRKQLISHRN